MKYPNMFQDYIDMLIINKIFIIDNFIEFHTIDGEKTQNFPINEISRITTFLDSDNKYQITTIITIRDEEFTFPYNIFINYNDFLDLIDYSNIRNFKAFLEYLDNNIEGGVLCSDTRSWILNNTPLPKNKEYPDDQNLRLSIAQLSLMTINAKIYRKTYKSRIEIFLYSGIGVLLLFLGYIFGYRQYLSDKFPFLFSLCIIGIIFIIFSFLPKKNQKETID